jgi:type VI secretion system secreted protein Hcp
MDVIIFKPGDTDIKGECQVKGFENQIECLSYNHGLSMQVTGDQSNTERTSGKPNHQDLTITKYLDLASIKLYEYLNKGQTLKQCVLTIARNDAGTITPLIIYTMDNMVVSSISTGGGGMDKPVETVTLNYTAIKWEYKQQKSDVSQQGTGSTTWNLATNQPT